MLIFEVAVEWCPVPLKGFRYIVAEYSTVRLRDFRYTAHVWDLQLHLEIILNSRFIISLTYISVSSISEYVMNEAGILPHLPSLNISSHLKEELWDGQAIIVLSRAITATALLTIVYILGVFLGIDLWAFWSVLLQLVIYCLCELITSNLQGIINWCL